MYAKFTIRQYHKKMKVKNVFWWIFTYLADVAFFASFWMILNILLPDGSLHHSSAFPAIVIGSLIGKLFLHKSFPNFKNWSRTLIVTTEGLISYSLVFLANIFVSSWTCAGLLFLLFLVLYFISAIIDQEKTEAFQAI
jgi:hypothetical protein